MKTLIQAAGLSLVLAAAAHAQTPSSAAPPKPATAAKPAPGEAAPGTVNPPAASTPSPTAPSTAAPSSTAPAAAATPPAVDTSATTSPYKTGMVVKDAQGSTIGPIAKVVRTPDGATTVSVTVGGRNVNLPASALTLGADGGAVSSMSKAQITASTAPPT